MPCLEDRPVKVAPVVGHQYTEAGKAAGGLQQNGRFIREIPCQELLALEAAIGPPCQSDQEWQRRFPLQSARFKIDKDPAAVAARLEEAPAGVGKHAEQQRFGIFWLGHGKPMNQAEKTPEAVSRWLEAKADLAEVFTGRSERGSHRTSLHVRHSTRIARARQVAVDSPTDSATINRGDGVRRNCPGLGSGLITPAGAACRSFFVGREGGSVQLHELHARRLEATILLLEESIARCQRWLNEESPGVLRVVRTGLDPERRSRLLELLEAFRQDLSGLAQQFRLQHHPVDLVQILNAEFSSAWVMLENCRPRRMKGYGIAFDPAVAAALDSAVDRLTARVDQLRALVAGESAQAPDAGSRS